jgi:glycosyltransferase involved in cell wall biosynthesis
MGEGLPSGAPAAILYAPLMYREKKIAVVVPAYNEEERIGLVVDTMPGFVDRIVVVNDCSKDRTPEVVRSHPQAARVELINHERNQGVGGAIATGYQWARDHGFDVAVVMAGDGQMNPADLPALLDPVVDDAADYAKGNRLVTGEAFRKIPKVRFFGNSVLSLMTKIASGYWAVADSQTGYTALNARGLRAIDWTRLYKRYGQPNDLLVKLNVAGLRVVDVPIEPVYHEGGKSGIRVPRVVFSIGFLLFRRFFWRLKEKYVVRDFHPLVFFYLFAFAFLGTSAALAVRMAVLWTRLKQMPEITFIGALFCLGMGFNALFFAMWFDYQANRHLNPPLSHRDVRRGGPAP